MAKKPTLSPTKITTFLACPMRYRWTYIDPRGKLYLRAKCYFSFGISLHKALELFHDTAETGVETKEELLAAYDDNWVEAGFRSEQEMTEAYGEGKEILERIADEETYKEAKGQTLFVEKELSFEYEKFKLLGRIDRLVETENGDYEVLDYKSGHTEPTDDSVQADIAMSIYQLLAKRTWPEKEVAARIIALRTGTEAAAKLSGDEMASFEEDIVQLGNKILTEDYYAMQPKQKALCEKCDFLNLCSKFQGFDAS